MNIVLMDKTVTGEQLRVASGWRGELKLYSNIVNWYSILILGRYNTTT